MSVVPDLLSASGESDGCYCVEIRYSISVFHTVGAVVFLLLATQKVHWITYVATLPHNSPHHLTQRIIFFWRRPASALSTRMVSPNQPNIPFLPAGDNVRDTMNTDRTSKNTYSSSIMLRDYYEAKAHGVEIIGRPDEAFPGAHNAAPRS